MLCCYARQIWESHGGRAGIRYERLVLRCSRWSTDPGISSWIPSRHFIACTQSPSLSLASIPKHTSATSFRCPPRPTHPPNSILLDICPSPCLLLSLYYPSLLPPVSTRGLVLGRRGHLRSTPSSPFVRLLAEHSNPLILKPHALLLSHAQSRITYQQDAPLSKRHPPRSLCHPLRLPLSILYLDGTSKSLGNIHIRALITAPSPLVPHPVQPQTHRYLQAIGSA